MNKKGFTITELLVTLFIIGIVLSAAYITYIRLLKGFKSEKEKIASQIENLVGLEILRLDLEHIGYGIPKEETKKLIEWDGSKLILRSTLNNTNKSTLGYLVGKCTSSQINITYDGREDKTNNYVTILQDDKSFFDKGTISSNIINSSKSCTSGNIYIAFPVRKKVYNGSSNDCQKGLCERITYSLTDSNLPDRCNVNTKKLIRRVGRGNTGGETVLSCIADWKITFDIDKNSDGKIDSSEENLDDYSLLSDNTTIRKKLKLINVYMLVQEGRYDPNFEYSNNIKNCGSDKCVSIDNIELKLPTDYNHYRWKVLKISVKPMDL